MRCIFVQAALHPGWLAELRGEHIPETEEYGISSFVYRRRRPIHPIRFLECVENSFVHSIGFYFVTPPPPPPPLSDPLCAIDETWHRKMGKNIIRSKGMIWLAVENEWALDWSQCGTMFQLNNSHRWLASIPREEWPADSPEEVFHQFGYRFGKAHLGWLFLLVASLLIALYYCVHKPKKKKNTPVSSPLTCFFFADSHHGQYASLEEDFCEDPEIGDRRQEVVRSFHNSLGMVLAAVVVCLLPSDCAVLCICTLSARSSLLVFKWTRMRSLPLLTSVSWMMRK